MARKRRRTNRQPDAVEAAPPRVKLRGPALWVAVAMPLVVLAAGFAAFYPALDAEFVSYDDDRLFVDNTSYRGFDSARLEWMFTTTFMGHYQPLTWLSSALDYTISGDDPTSYHRNNLVLHALNGLLVYFAAGRLLAAALRIGPRDHPVALRLASGAAALLFAVHPLRVESVAWASERRDVLSMFFLLAALLAYLRAFRPAEVKVGRWGWYVASWGLLVLSLLSKAWGMSFVIAVAVLDVHPLRRLPAAPSAWLDQRYRAVWLQKVPYLLLGLAAAVKAGAAQRSALDTMKSLTEWGLVERGVQAIYGLAFYLAKTVWPTHLVALYELPNDLQPFELHYVLSFLLVAAVVTAAILLRRRRPSLAVACVIYAVILAPVLGFFQSGPQFVADKYSYVSCLGWALLAGGGLLALWRRQRSPAWGVGLTVAAAVVIAGLFVKTWQQTHVWHDSKTLWAHALEAGAPSSVAHLNYGVLLREEGAVDEAIKHYRAALELDPNSGNAWYALGNALKKQEQYTEAAQAYLRAVETMTQKHKAYLNLGNTYRQNLRRPEDAIAAYRAGIEYAEAFPKKISPANLYLALGVALRAKGEYEEARQLLNAAARYKRTKKQAQQELARLPRDD